MASLIAARAAPAMPCHNFSLQDSADAKKGGMNTNFDIVPSAEKEGASTPESKPKEKGPKKTQSKDAPTTPTNWTPKSKQLAEYKRIFGAVDSSNSKVVEGKQAAKFLKSSGLQALINLRSGKPGPLPPPIADFEKNLCGQEKQLVSQSRSASSTGSAEKIREDVTSFLKLTEADELIFTSQIFDHAARVESYAITQQACLGL